MHYCQEYDIDSLKSIESYRIFCFSHFYLLYILGTDNPKSEELKPIVASFFPLTSLHIQGLLSVFLSRNSFVVVLHSLDSISFGPA